MSKSNKRQCIDCDAEFTPYERRGDGPHRYKGYYCEDCDSI